jgi:O-antigen/teichoic acid export membrane protein
MNNLLKNVLSVGVVQIANYLIPLISVPIIVRIIGPAHFGIINYYSAFIAYFVLIINYGFDYTGTRFIATDKDNIARRNLHFTKVIYAKCFLFLISFVTFSAIIFFVARSTDETKIAFYTFLICISWAVSPNWFYQGMQDLTKVAIFNLVSKVIYTVLTLVLIKNQSDYIWQPLALSVTQIFISVASLYMAIRKYDIKLVETSFKDILTLLWSDRLIFFTMIASNLYTDTNIVILGFYETNEHVGYFAAAWKFIFIFLMVISFPLSQALFPYIAEAISKNVDKGIQQIRRMLPIIIYFTLGCSIVVYFLGGYMIRTFYGDRFEQSIYIFKILTLVPVLSYINTILGLQTMVNLKMDKPYFFIILFGGIFSVLFNLIVVRFYGYKGCAWSWIITEVLICLVSYIYLLSQKINVVELKYFGFKNVLEEIKWFIGNLKKKRSDIAEGTI